MKPNYQVESQPCYSIKNQIAVFNYHLIDLIQNIPIIDREIYNEEHLIGFWKIKNLKV